MADDRGGEAGAGEGDEVGDREWERGKESGRIRTLGVLRLRAAPFAQDDRSLLRFGVGDDGMGQGVGGEALGGGCVGEEGFGGEGCGLREDEGGDVGAAFGESAGFVEGDGVYGG